MVVKTNEGKFRREIQNDQRDGTDQKHVPSLFENIYRYKSVIININLHKDTPTLQKQIYTQIYTQLLDISNDSLLEIKSKMSRGHPS